MILFDRSILRLPIFDDQHRELAAKLEDWVEKNQPNAGDWWNRDPSSVVKEVAVRLGEAGLLAAAVSGARDGTRSGPDFRSICLIREALSYAHDLYDYVFSIQSLAGYCIACHGTELQRQTYLPLLEQGRSLGTFAISEAACGSDVAGVRLSASREGSGYRLSGEKAWIAIANIADFHCVLARTGDGPATIGMSFFIVPSTTADLHCDAIDLLAPRPIGNLRLMDCLVPHDALLGKPGYGFRYALETLERYRITVGATAIGFSRRAFKEALGRARSRKVADGSLFDLQLTKAALADMAVYLDSASLMVARAAWEVDTGQLDTLSRHSSGAKLFATEGAQRVVDDALQIFGAAGLVADSITAELYRQVRLLRIYEGTSEIQKLIVASTLR